MHSTSVIEVSAPVHFCGSEATGDGVIVEISADRARIEASAARLKADATVSLSFRFFEGSPPIEVSARIVERGEHGFAAEFTGLKVVKRNLLRLMLDKLQACSDYDRSDFALLRTP